MENNKALVKATDTAVEEYGKNGANLAQLLAEELDGLTLSFDRIKIPAGGGLAYEVPSDNPDSPDMAREFKAVILYHHPVNTYYKEKYTGGNSAPDCASRDGHVGTEAEGGEIKNCADCEFNKFGSGENGAKACKQKRRVYILLAGEALPTIFSVSTGSLKDFSKYITRLLSKGKPSNQVVTKFALKKAQNAGGIAYSQAVLSAERELTPEEYAVIAKLTEQVKAIAGKVGVTREASDGE
jgi:hypothetical protein